MSDNEVINRPHSPEESSGDESSSEVTNNGFSHDGEPVNRPRKVGDGSAQLHFFKSRFHRKGVVVLVPASARAISSVKLFEYVLRKRLFFWLRFRILP